MNFEDRFKNQVTVIGAGTMGVGIAELFIRRGWQVNLVDKDLRQLDAACNWIVKNGGGRSEELLKLLQDISELQQAEFVIECVPEEMRLKIDVLTELESRLKPRLLCSNTSSLSISDLQAALSFPSNFLGLHFFQPVQQTGLIEVITGTQTAAVTLRAGVECSEFLERRPVVVKDSPGFATSRLGIAIGLEAMRMLEEGIATAEDIDAGMQLGYGHMTGPLRMTDMVGLDVRLAISEYLAEKLGTRFEPPSILREKVSNGHLGRKVGRGFFEWDDK